MPINFAVVFRAAVSGVTIGDVTLSGTAAATTQVVTEIASNNGTTFNVAVSGMFTSGTVIATVPAGVAQDGLRNRNLASTSTDNKVTYDLGYPTVLSSTPSNNATLTTNPVRLTVRFSKDVKATILLKAIQPITCSWKMVRTIPSIQHPARMGW